MIDRVRFESPVSAGRLWFGLLAAPLAWGIAGLGDYLYATATCRTHHLVTGASSPMSSAAVGIWSLVMLVVALAGLIAALGSWRALGNATPPDDTRAQRESGVTAPEPHGSAPWWGRSRFMAGGAMFTSALFLLGIVLFTIPALLVQPCSHIH